MRILDQLQVRELLTMELCIDALTDVFAALARGEAIQPLRGITWLPDRSGALGLMPSYLEDPRSLGVKVLTVFPGNEATEYESHQGAVLLFDAENGRLLALMDASEITAIRTAAASAVATRLLAREDSKCVAILGTGTQARTHVEAMRAVRPIESVRLWGRTFARADALARNLAAAHDVEVTVWESARDAVTGADIICTVTGSSTPVLRGAWLESGVHVNAVGACTPTTRELDSAAVASARLYVDRRESALAEAGDFLQARDEGAVDEDHIVGEIGEVLIGAAAGRGDDGEITLFESLGIGVEDLAAAHLLHTRAVELGIGIEVELGGVRE